MTITRTDFPLICRLCLLFEENMSSIHTPEVIKMVQICVDIEIKVNDDFPSSICKNCYDQMNKFSYFRESCKNSQETLQKIVCESSDYYSSSEKLESTTKDQNVKDEFSTQIKTEPFDSDNDYKDDLDRENNDDDDDDEDDNSTDDNKVNNGSVKEENRDKMKDNIEAMLSKIDKTSKKSVSCKLCGKTMPERTLYGHLRYHQQGTRHKCDLCSKAYRKPGELAKHLQRVHKSKSVIKCNVCNKTFQIQAQLDFHKKTHFNKKYPCDICGKECYLSANLKRHKETHTKREKSFFCLHCDSTFLGEVSLKIHVKKYHSDTPQEKHACPLCGKMVYNVRLHTLNTHSNVRPHKCDQCDKAFGFKSVLLKHVREKHLGIQQEYKALCPSCGKSCPSQGDLRKHLRTHAKDRQLYDCHLCGKKYKSREGLRNHLKVHSGVRPYVCTYCTKAFHTSTILKNHIRTHTGERPFACHICGRAFTQKVSLQTHVKGHND